MKIMLVASAVAGVAVVASAASIPETRILPAQTEAVFIGKETISKAFAGPTSALALGSLAAVRAGNDRISVDILKRTDAAAEGPLSHDVVTEIYYILDGGGVMETGGTIVDPGPLLTNGKPTNPASIGPSKVGTKMTGGTTHHVGVGDVVMIPPNVVHRFKSLDGSVTYMVVRVNPGYEKGN